MKNLFRTVVSAFLTLLVSLPLMAADMQDKKPEPTPPYKPIVIREEPGIVQRSSVPPFDLSYQSGFLVAEFYDNIGSVSITIMNLNTGEMWNAVLDSSLVIQTIDISTDNWTGYYELMLSDSRNNCYSGYFEL